MGLTWLRDRSLAQPPKYTCPKCMARTCSVACVARHRKRARCDGRRDPTGFVSTSQLATPAAFDRDYNFLAGIERALHSSAAARPSSSDHHRTGRRHRQKLYNDNSSAMAARLREHGVVVERAPEGLRRHTENRTRWDRR